MVYFKLSIWKQDQSVAEVGLRPAEIAAIISPVYSLKENKFEVQDEYIKVSTRLSVVPNDQGKGAVIGYLPKNKLEKNVINVYGTAKIVINTFHDSLKRIGKPADHSRVYDKGHLRIIINNYYHEKEDNFEDLLIGYFKNTNTIYLNDLYLEGFDMLCSRSFDIIAHEVGHYLLYQLFPNLDKSRHDVQKEAFKEAFSDLVMFFSLLSQDDVCELTIESTQEFMAPDSEDNFISRIGEQYSHHLYEHYQGVRNLIVKSNYNHFLEHTDDHYEQSLSFSGAIYNSCIDIFRLSARRTNRYPASVLKRINFLLNDLFIGAVHHLLNQDIEEVNLSLLAHSFLDTSEQYLNKREDFLESLCISTHEVMRIVRGHFATRSLTE